jgi:hypothetical protein
MNSIDTPRLENLTEKIYSLISLTEDGRHHDCLNTGDGSEITRYLFETDWNVNIESEAFLIRCYEYGLIPCAALDFFQLLAHQLYFRENDLCDTVAL